MEDNLFIALKLTSIAFVSVLLLSGVNFLTFSRIEQNKMNEKALVYNEFFPDAGKITKEQTFKNAENDTDTVYAVVYDKREKISGYLVSTVAMGYNGKIDLIIAFDSELVVKNMKMLSNEETSGFGKRWEQEKYMEMFVGTNSDEVSFPAKKSMVRDEYADGVSGATITFNGLAKAGDEVCQLLEAEVK